MNKLAELKEKLKELSPEELEQFKAFLTTDEESAEETKEPATETKEEEKTEGSTSSEEKAEDNVKEEINASTEEVTETEEKPAEAGETTPAEEVPTTEENGEIEGIKETTEPEQTTEEDDDIPQMTKGEPVGVGETDTVDNSSVTAETGETLPIDYEQIVEGLNAKIAALEAENASLKNKVNGAFGYSAKPSAPAKVNRLYDECEDVHFHR